MGASSEFLRVGDRDANFPAEAKRVAKRLFPALAEYGLVVRLHNRILYIAATGTKFRKRKLKYYGYLISG